MHPPGQLTAAADPPAAGRPAGARHLVVVPAYNEEAALPGALAELARLPDGYDVLVVNDGSADRTGATAERLAAASGGRVRVVHLPLNCGIGGAVQTGFRYALAAAGRYEYVVQCDADGQHDPADIPRLVAACRERDLDLCVGSRFLGDGDGDGGPGGGAGGDRSTFWRRAGIGFFRRLLAALSGVAVTDPTSGLRCCGPRAWGRFAAQYPADYPEPESLHWAARSGLRVGEVAVRMRPRAGGVSSITPFRGWYYMVKVSAAILADRVRAEGR